MAKTRKAMKPKQPAADELSENEDSTDVYEVEKILDKKDSIKGLEYYVKWRGYPAGSNTWEPAENILQQKLIKDFERRQAAGPPTKRGQKKKKVEVTESEEEEEEEEADDLTVVADDEEADASNVEEEEDEEKEEEEVVAEEPEPVKPKRARTAATKAPAKKAPAPKPKAQPKGKNDPDLEPEPTSKSAVKVKMTPLAKRATATEPKAKRLAEPRPNKTTTALAKPKANPIEPKKAPTRRNVPLKRTAASAAKEIGMEKAQAEDEQEEDRDMEDVPDSPAIDVENATVASVAHDIEFSKFKIDRLINESLLSKTITFFGSYKGEDAVILLEKTVFTEDGVKEALGDKNTVAEKDFQNDIYHSYKIRSQESTSSLNKIKATVVYPANESVFAKYSRDETILYTEKPEVYTEVVEPFIDSTVNGDSDPNRWLYNILDGKSEADRVIFNDPDPNSGFMLVPDLKWSGDVKDLNLVAMCHRRDLRSLRDLNEKHLILLKNIMTKGTKAIKDKFKDFKGELRSYIHYQPSFYHFHVHFKIVDAHEYSCSDRDNLLATVINNIILKKDYYKKSILVYPLSQSHALYRELEKAKLI